MQEKDKKYFRQRLLALRNAIDEVVGELGDSNSDPAPRIRRNLKKERVENHETNYAMNRWKKPESLKKIKRA